MGVAATERYQGRKGDDADSGRKDGRTSDAGKLTGPPVDDRDPLREQQRAGACSPYHPDKKGQDHQVETESIPDARFVARDPGPAELEDIGSQPAGGSIASKQTPPSWLPGRIGLKVRRALTKLVEHRIGRSCLHSRELRPGDPDHRDEFDVPE